MRLVVIGCSGSFPGPDSPASSYLVEADDGAGRTWRVLLDLGNGALGPLQRVVDPAELDAVALSHLHPDHMADMCGLYVYLRYRPAREGDPPRVGTRLPVLGPEGTSQRLAEVYGLAPGETMDEQLEVRTWAEGEPVRFGPLELEPVAVEHPVPAFGVRVTGPSEQDPDRQVVLAYTGDTDAGPGVDRLARGADLLLAEAAFLEGRDTVRGIHLTGRRAGEVAQRAGVGRLVLTHIPAWNDPAETYAEARAVFDGPIDLAESAAVFTL